MNLDNYEERFFWKKAYMMAIKAGKGPLGAREIANEAVRHLREVPVIRSSSTN